MGQPAGPGAHRQAVGVAAAVAGKLDYLVPSGEGPGQADGARTGFGAGVDQPQRLDAGQRAGDEPGRLDLLLHRRSEAGTAGGGTGQGGHHRRVGAAQHQRPPGAEAVNVFVAVHVDDAGALPEAMNGGALPRHGKSAPGC